MALNFFYLILILPYWPLVSVFPWEIFSHPFIFSPSECACGVCGLFDLALSFQQIFKKMILEYKSIHSFNKYLLRDKAPSKTKEELSFPAVMLQPVTHSPEHHDPSSFYYHLPVFCALLPRVLLILPLHWPFIRLGFFFPLFNDLEITLLISIFLVVAIKF